METIRRSFERECCLLSSAFIRLVHSTSTVYLNHWYLHTGIVPANSTLECEFIHYAAYDHPDTVVFNLLLDDGKSEKIECIAKVSHKIDNVVPLCDIHY